MANGQAVLSSAVLDTAEVERLQVDLEQARAIDTSRTRCSWVARFGWTVCTARRG